MRKLICILLASLLALLAGFALAGCADNGAADTGGGNGTEQGDTPGGGEETGITVFDNSQNPIAERLGITCWGCRYMPDLEAEENSLLRGAEYILEAGGKVIKIACGDLRVQYPLDDWSGVTFERSVDVFRHDVFRTLFAMDFKTFFISVPERSAINFRDGVSKEEEAYVEEEFYQMTKYLLETYKGSGKTFVLQNWETDNALSYSMNGTEDDYLLLYSYADYFNARQDGINRARDEFVMSEKKNVYVFGALEVNKLSDSYTRPKAVDYVVPNTYCDLYTYSSYEYKDRGVVRSAQDVCDQLSEALNYYASQLPAEKNYPQPVYFGDRRLAVTEFGYPDYADGYKSEWQKMVAEGHLLAAEELGLQYFVYWQLCDNEVIGNNASEINRLSPAELRGYAFAPGDLNGFWLIRPDGVKTYTYNYFKQAILQDSAAAEAEKPSAWSAAN